MAAKIESFEDLIVWQESVKLVEDLHFALSWTNGFWIKNQILRAALSVPSNIAEGYERMYNREYIRFLKIAKGSAGELRTQVHLAIRVGVFTAQQGDVFINRCKSISRMLQNLIATRTKWINPLQSFLALFFPFI